MNLSVAVRMNQQAVFHLFCTTHRLMNDVVVVPTCYRCDWLVTDGTDTVLFTPQVHQRPSSLKGVLHPHALALFQVEFPFVVIRIAVTLDFGVPLDGNTRSLVEPVFNSLALPVFEFAEESPMLVAVCAEVFSFDPASSFVGMSSSCPFPQCLEDSSIHVDKGFLACGMPVKVRPSSNDRVQASYQVVCRDFSIGLDDLSEIREECLDVLFRWPGEELPIVFTDMLSEKVKSVFNVRNPGFLLREFQSSFAEKCRDEWFDFILQKLFRDAGNDEIIRVSHQIHLLVHARHGFASGEVILLTKYGLQSVQGHVGKDRRDDAALRRAIFCLIEDRLIHVPRFQPFLEDDFIHGDVGQQPVVADSVEAGFNVSFQYPRWAGASGQCVIALCHGIGAASFLAESIRIGVRVGFRDGIKGQQVQRLHGSVLHRGDTERAFLPVRFGDVHSSERAWVISASFQIVYGVPLLRGVIPDYSVNPGRVLALVFRHSSDSKDFATKRAGQQVLQGLYLVPLTGLHCLHDPCLKPTHSLIDLLPINGMPVLEVVGSSTSRRFRCHLQHFLSGFFKYFRVHRPGGSLPAFASGNVKPRIRLVTRRHSLSPPSFTRIAIGSPCGVPTSIEEQYGLTVFRVIDKGGVGALCSPVALVSMSEYRGNSEPGYNPVLGQAGKHLRPVTFDDVYREFTYVHHAIHSGPSPPDAGRYTIASRFLVLPKGHGYVVRGL